MSKFNELKVRSATLLQHIFVIGHGQVGPKLNSKNDGVNKAVEMEIQEPYLVVRFPKSLAGAEHIELIPLTMVQQINPIVE